MAACSWRIVRLDERPVNAAVYVHPESPYSRYGSAHGTSTQKSRDRAGSLTRTILRRGVSEGLHVVTDPAGSWRRARGRSARTSTGFLPKALTVQTRAFRASLASVTWKAVARPGVRLTCTSGRSEPDVPRLLRIALT